jgi:predicted ArsR family transcriptional regulator
MLRDRNTIAITALRRLDESGELTARALYAILEAPPLDLRKVMRSLQREGLCEGFAGQPGRGGFITRWRITPKGRALIRGA